MIPSIPEITRAAHASSRAMPRPSRAFWFAACRLILSPLGDIGYAALCEAHEWTFKPRTPGKAKSVALERLAAMGEADLRAALVEISIYASPNEDTARQTWADALHMRDEEGGS